LLIHERPSQNIILTLNLKNNNNKIEPSSKFRQIIRLAWKIL